MSGKLFQLLLFLSDGEWHGESELMQVFKLNKKEFNEVAAFLSRFNFVEVRNKKLRIKMEAREFLMRTQPAAAHV